MGFHEATKLPTARLDLIVEQAAEPEMGIFARQAKFAQPNRIPIDKDLFLQDLEGVVQRVNDGGNAEQLLQSLETKMTNDRRETLRRQKMTQRDTSQ